MRPNYNQPLGHSPHQRGEGWQDEREPGSARWESGLSPPWTVVPPGPPPRPVRLGRASPGSPTCVKAASLTLSFPEVFLYHKPTAVLSFTTHLQLTFIWLAFSWSSSTASALGYCPKPWHQVSFHQKPMSQDSWVLQPWPGSLASHRMTSTAWVLFRPGLGHGSPQERAITTDSSNSSQMYDTIASCKLN